MKPADALVMFCAHYLEAMLYEASVQMPRVSMAETTRFPEGAAQHYDAMFTEVETRLGAYLKSTFGLSARASADAAQRLLAQILFPRFQRALFGLEDLVESFDDNALSPKIDLRPLRKAVANLLESLPAK